MTEAIRVVITDQELSCSQYEAPITTRKKLAAAGIPLLATFGDSIKVSHGVLSAQEDFNNFCTVYTWRNEV